jgi:hypothetical protein
MTERDTYFYRSEATRARMMADEAPTPELKAAYLAIAHACDERAESASGHPAG